MIQHPRIGIRPTIDGRRQGVRESLEVQTMNMAKSVADLISSTLKYPDGEPVECVISPSTIGRVPEAAASHELFKKSNVCATITVTPCWCYGSETMDMSPDIPHAIWGFMVEMFRKLMIQLFQKMSKKNFYVMRVQLLQLA